MYYSTSHPDQQRDRVRLYPSIPAAIAAAGDYRPVYEVALDLHAGERLVVSDQINAPDFDPDWTTRAQLHGDGSVTAKGRIPRELFVGSIYSPQCLARIQDSRESECA